MSAKNWIAIIATLAVLAGFGGYSWLDARRATLPAGIIFGNGRLEAEQIDVSAKTPGRVEQIFVREGEMVSAGDTLVQMDIAELTATLERARAQIALARQQKAEAEALVLQRQSELQLAENELARAQSLLEKGHISQAIFEHRQTALKVAEAVLGAARAHVATSESQISATEAEARRIAAQITDSTLIAAANGRVLYRLAEPGEVVAAGGPVLSLLSLEEVYMEIFLPATDAGLLRIGAEARIVVDALPDYAVPAEVSFVSPEAQFTPKQVETLAEREKLVFRVKVKIPPDLVAERIEHVKTGLRGMAYVRLSPSVVWPERLNRRIPPELFE
ncbi:MAG: efflux RND transporter periplasmic adaptor subunit [Paracoccaceae bacterium]|nr:efflux RND transporter periplasmic adaptor subunit [Paracoccaceae bacterium]